MPTANLFTLLAVLVLMPECSIVVGVADEDCPPVRRSRISRSTLKDRVDTVRTQHAEDEAIKDIVTKIREWQIKGNMFQSDKRPFVTLSYAQSLDGHIAVLEPSGETSSNLPLSGEQSLRLTHALRSIHDAVLVGGKTFAADNPRLNVRSWPSDGRLQGRESDPNNAHQPRPVVLDTELKSLHRLQRKGGTSMVSIRAKNPIICCAQDVFDDSNLQLHSSMLAEVDILPCKRDTTSRKGLNLKDVLKQLREQRDIRSIMVEGGATMLASFANSNCVNCVCITIAPKLIGGRRGVNAFGGYDASSTEATFQHLDSDSSNRSTFPWRDFGVDEKSGAAFITDVGSDCIFLAKWPKWNISL